MNETLWMRDSIDYTLVNPNQLRHHGVNVQDDPISERPLSIITSDAEFAMGLNRKGTIVYFNSQTPTQKKIYSFSPIIISAKLPLDPEQVNVPNRTHSLDLEVERIRLLGDQSLTIFINNLDLAMWCLIFLQ